MKFLLLRRLVQICILVLFVLGNVAGVKVLLGNLSASTFLGFSLLDPLAFLQLFLAGGAVTTTAFVGAWSVLLFYALVAPRAFCGWVCPVNLVTDAANFARKKLGFTGGFLNVSHRLRYALLALLLVFSFVLGISVWEKVNFVAFFTRSLVVLSGSAVAVAGVLFAFEFFAGKRTLCSRLCPLGAFYAIFSTFSLIRIRYDLDKCTRCGKCVSACPEEQVLGMVGKKSAQVGSECVSCGRCVSVCEDDALKFSLVKFMEKRK